MFEKSQIVLTGRLWLGASGSRGIGTTLIEMISEAKNEIIIVAYRLTIAVAELNMAIEKALARGCIVRIILDARGAELEIERKFFESWLKNYHQQIEILEFYAIEEKFVSLHAKVVVCDRRKAMVGSANFSKNGLENNHEMAVLLTGKTVRSVAKSIDQLVREGMRLNAIEKRRIID